MKRTALLNRHLSTLVAELGHLDEIVVADAGLPVPPGVPVIDLAVTAGVPTLSQVLRALSTELVIDGALWAEEAAGEVENRLDAEIVRWGHETGTEVATDTLSHEDFKARTAFARAIIRTGETTPYANVILISGVAF